MIVPSINIPIHTPIHAWRYRLRACVNVHIKQALNVVTGARLAGI